MAEQPDRHGLAYVERTQGVHAGCNGRWVHTTVTGTNKVAVISTRTLDIVKQIPVSGTIPFWLAVAGHD